MINGTYLEVALSSAASSKVLSSDFSSELSDFTYSRQIGLGREVRRKRGNGGEKERNNKVKKKGVIGGTEEEHGLHLLELSKIVILANGFKSIFLYKLICILCMCPFSLLCSLSNT